MNYQKGTQRWRAIVGVQDINEYIIRRLVIIIKANISHAVIFLVTSFVDNSRVIYYHN